MRSLLLTFSIIAVYLLATPQNLGAHIGDRIFPIIELTDEDLVQLDLKDGSIVDWQEVVGEPSLISLDFSIHPRAGDGGSYDPFDLDFRIWLGWHQATSRIYVAIEIVDNLYVNEYKGRKSDSPLGNDSVTFRIDGDHSGGEYNFFLDEFSTQDEWRHVQQSQAQIYYVIAQAPDDGHVTHLLPMLSGPSYRRTQMAEARY